MAGGGAISAGSGHLLVEKGRFISEARRDATQRRTAPPGQAAATRAGQSALFVTWRPRRRGIKSGAGAWLPREAHGEASRPSCLAVDEDRGLNGSPALLLPRPDMLVSR